MKYVLLLLFLSAYPLKSQNCILSLYHTFDTVFVYNPEESQTDDTPFLTADGTKITYDNAETLMAISPDLMGKFKFGDEIFLEIGNQLHRRQIRDIMNERHNNCADLLYIDRKLGKWDSIDVYVYTDGQGNGCP